MLDSEAIASADINANFEGWQHLVEGQTEVAIEDFTRAIALGQEVPVAYNNRGIAHEVLEQMVEAQADYSEANRLAETDSELRQRLESVRKRKPIGWKGRKEPAAKTEAEGTDFLISFCNLDHKESNVAWDSWKKESSFKEHVVAGLKTCGFHRTNADFEWDSSFFSIFFHGRQVFSCFESELAVLRPWRYLFTELLGHILHHTSIMWQFWIAI